MKKITHEIRDPIHVFIKLDTTERKVLDSINDFPIQLQDETIVSALTLSKTLSHLPPAAVDCVFIKPSLLNEAREWLKKSKNDIIKLP